MSVLIKGMEMPKEKKITLTIFPDGRVYENHGERLWGHGEDCIPWKAIPVPPHGRLIDADALGKVMSEGIAPSVKDGGFKHPFDIIRAVANAPTIIPAEEVET